MKVLVTGASGFIGREIVSELLARDYQVVALQNSAFDSAKKGSNIERFSVDITKYENVSELENLRGVKTIIHSAGLAHQFGETKKEEFEKVNVSGTENILRLAVKINVEHFILIGSTAVYGVLPTDQAADVYTENTSTNPQTDYAVSKLAAERVCQKECRENGISLTIFRLAPVIGEANVGNVARLIAAIDRRRFVWIGRGENLKSLIYKRDVARACVELIEKKLPREEIFNLAAEPVLMKNFVAEISKNLDGKLFPVAIPADLVRWGLRTSARLFRFRKIGKLSETIEKWLADDVYSAEKIAETYGFRPQTPIDEALARQVKHYLANHEKQ